MTIPNIGLVRTWLEIHFYLSLHGCPACGEHDIGEPKTDWAILVKPDGKHFGGYYHLTCPRCGHQRSIEFFEGPNFWRKDLEWGHLGGAEPSTIISAREFSTELERCVASLWSDFASATKAELDAQGLLHDNATICANELLKFMPADADELPEAAFAGADAAYRDAHRAQLTRTYLVDQSAKLVALTGKFRARAEELEIERDMSQRRRLPLPPFSLAAIKLHEKWYFEGEVGENQPIVARGADAREMQLSTRTLSKAVLDKVTLDRANLSYGFLDEAVLTDVHMQGTDLSNGSAIAARFTRCRLVGIDGTLWKLREATFDDCDLTGAWLTRSVWTQVTATGCVFRGADLRNARLDGAMFTDCDFRDADLRVVEAGINTARGARFVRCDLRGTKWDGRELDRVELVDCKLAGATGPATLVALEVTRADLSPQGDASQLVSSDEIAKLLG